MYDKKLKLILACSINGVIGKDNTLPWRIPEDMRYFKQVTEGHSVIMGRKTWESIPEKFRPLPNRVNTVISRHHNYDAKGALVCQSIEQAINFSNPGVVWVIGGASIYEEVLKNHRVEEIHITIVEKAYEGDAFFNFSHLHKYRVEQIHELGQLPEGNKVRTYVYRLNE